MRLHHAPSLVFIVVSISNISTTTSFFPSLLKQPLKTPYFAKYRETASTSDPSTATNDREVVRIRELLKSVPLAHDDHKKIANGSLETLGHNREELVQTILAATPDQVVLLTERPHLVKHHPHLAQHILQPDAFISPIEQWITRYLRLSKSDAAKIKRVQSLGRYRLKLWFTYFLSEIGLTNSELRKIVVSRPNLLSYKLSNIQSTIHFFHEEVGLSKSEIRSIIKAYPSVLTYSVANRLRPHIHFLQNEIGGGIENWKAWKKVVCTYPQFFSHSLKKTLLPKIHFFCDEENDGSLQLKKSELSQIVSKFPPTLWLSNENLNEKFKFLTESLELDSNELRAIVLTYPQVLGLSLQNNLKPKMEFFLGGCYEDSKNCNDDHDFNCGFSKEELKDFVLYQPALLAYSLEGRLKPRVHHMKQSNISFRYCPKNIMSYTDDRFNSWYVF